jgi:hypothetical protein
MKPNRHQFRRNRRILSSLLAATALAAAAAGCQGFLEHSERELADNAKTLEIARNYLPVRQTQIGFINGYADVDELPAEIGEAMDELLDLARTDPNGLDNYELGRSLGLGVRITEGLILHYVPELQRYWR